jgi:hypothetical protein
MYASDNWDAMFTRGLGSQHKVVPLAQGTEAIVVERHERPTDGYGDYLQSDDEIYVIFQVGDRFFKKTGRMDSYDEIRTWDGPVTEVFGETKQVTVFVPKGHR